MDYQDVDTKSNTLTFQIVDLVVRDEVQDAPPKQVVVNIFGVTAEGASMHLKVHGFRPSFYIDAPRSVVEDAIATLGRNTLIQHKVTVTEEVARPFVGYAPPRTFVKLTMASMAMRWRLADVFYDTKLNMPRSIGGRAYGLFEAKLPPLLRFLHERQLSPVGWLSVASGTYKIIDDADQTSTSLLATCDVLDVTPRPDLDNTMAPLLIASFDIECHSEDGSFPCPERRNDPVIQIGCILQRLNGPAERFIWVLGTCDAVPDTTVVSCSTECDLLLLFAQWFQARDPDVVIGYNIFGFDFKYMYKRAQVLNIAEQFACFTRFGSETWPLEIVERKSAAFGDNVWHILPMPGRVQIDLYQVMKRDESLASYKLDDVAFHFLKQQKHDVSPRDIWELHPKSATDRATIAAYCVQDCMLPLLLLHKMDMLVKKRGMAHVCGVPLSFIFNRGQGIKLYSLVSKACREMGFKIADLYVDEDDINEGYAGAIVLKPVVQAHFCPVTVNDFNSLYPSASIGHNLCPTTWINDEAIALPAAATVWTVQWRDIQTKDPQEWPDEVAPVLSLDAALPVQIAPEVPADWRVWEAPWAMTPTWSPDTKRSVQALFDASPIHQYHFVQPALAAPDQSEADREGRGVVPRILITLLAQRKHYKRLMEAESDPFQARMLDALQLSYKVTANSLYGQLGARTSAIRCEPVAASITATGRMLLLQSAAEIVKLFPGADIVYGDTDSLFVKYPLPDGLDAVAQRRHSMACGEALDKHMQTLLPWPHRLAYEKIYHPFLLLNKKKYTALMYESDPTKVKKTDNKGLISKRRDNAPIAQLIYNKLIESLLRDQSAAAARAQFRSDVTALLNGQVPIEQLLISKTLKQEYKMEPGHKILADRMLARDPGSAPRVGDRVPYLFIAQPPARRGALHSQHKKLQADIMEHPDWVRQHHLPIDYLYYLEHQVMKPVEEVLALFDDPGHLVGDLIRAATNKRNGQRDIMSFFKK